MATQLKHTDFTYTPTRPNIRVAFIAGEATTAVHQAKLPDATLEELSLRSETEALIGKACELLSPRMYDAFLRWGEAAVRTNIRNDDQASATRECTTASNAVAKVGSTDAQNMHDMLFKAYLLGLEAADCPSFGPLRIDPNHASGYVIEGVVTGLTSDMAFFSPLCRMIDDLGGHAWEESNSRSAITAEVGAALIQPFRDALAGLPIPLSMDGYDAHMRGPLIQWEAAYARYREASDVLAAYDRDVHTPTDARLSTLCRLVDADSANAELVAERDRVSAQMVVVQDRYDELCSAQFNLVNRLFTLPAPGPSELAIKLRLYSDLYQWDGGEKGRAAREQITIDARRFGRLGAHLQTDQVLLDAYADRRRTFESNRDRMTNAAEDDAYFARLDACDETLLNTRATTLEGVIAKMRVAFANQDGDGWSDLAAADPSQPVFVEGVRMSDVFTRLAWSAIEDLARIGGLSLSEQGR